MLYICECCISYFSTNISKNIDRHTIFLFNANAVLFSLGLCSRHLTLHQLISWLPPPLRLTPPSEEISLISVEICRKTNIYRQRKLISSSVCFCAPQARNVDHFWVHCKAISPCKRAFSMYFWRRFKVKNVLAEYENTKISACGGQIVKIFQKVSKKRFSKGI